MMFYLTPESPLLNYNKTVILFIFTDFGSQEILRAGAYLDKLK